jgi:hypothetical protein
MPLSAESFDEKHYDDFIAAKKQYGKNLGLDPTRILLIMNL